MERYAKAKMELAPRDVVSRAVQTEIDEGRGIGGQDCVYLDLRHLGRADDPGASCRRCASWGSSSWAAT